MKITDTYRSYLLSLSVISIFWAFSIISIIYYFPSIVYTIEIINLDIKLASFLIMLGVTHLCLYLIKEIKRRNKIKYLHNYFNYILSSSGEKNLNNIFCKNLQLARDNYSSGDIIISDNIIVLVLKKNGTFTVYYNLSNLNIKNKKEPF